MISSGRVEATRMFFALLLGSLSFAGCSGSRPGPAPAPAPVPVPTPPAATVRAEPPISEAARRLVEKAVSGMGGAAVVDGVRTLVLRGRILQHSDSGDYEGSVTTTFVYPDRMRRDLVLPTGATVSTIFTREHAYLIGAAGKVELPPAEKDRLEASALLTPLSIVKARRHPLFRAVPVDAGGRLEIRIADERTAITLDDEGRIIEQELQLGDAVASTGAIRVRYSDFQRTDGLLYPFSAEAFSGSRLIYSIALDSVQANAVVPDSLFDPTPPQGTHPAPTPSRN